MSLVALAATVYAIGYLVALRPIFRWAINDVRWGDQELDWGDVFEAGVMTIGACWGWPVIGVCLVIRRSVDPDAFVRRVGGESKEAKARRLEKERRERERYIADLERQLGIEA